MDSKTKKVYLLVDDLSGVYEIRARNWEHAKQRAPRFQSYLGDNTQLFQVDSSNIKPGAQNYQCATSWLYDLDKFDKIHVL